MPTLPKSPCTAPRCPNRTPCPVHLAQRRRRHDETRPTAAGRGYDAEWRRFSAYVLALEPHCRMCGALAEEVDHIRPLREGGARFDLANVRPLCGTCHRRVTARQHGLGGAQPHH